MADPNPKELAAQLLRQRVPFKETARRTGLTIGQAARVSMDDRGGCRQPSGHVRYHGDWDRFLFEPYAERKKRRAVSSYRTAAPANRVTAQA